MIWNGIKNSWGHICKSEFQMNFLMKKTIPNTFSRDLAQDLQHHLEKNKSSTTPLCPGDQLLLESEKKREENLKHLVAFYKGE